MLLGVDDVVHRVEALPGSGRYAVTFRRGDGSEQSAVVHVDGTPAAPRAEVAEASLPAGWRRDGPAFRAVIEALLALEQARAASAPAATTLRDLDGGWDVSLGNVVLLDGVTPGCIAHGPMQAGSDGVWTCEACGAAAQFG